MILIENIITAATHPRFFACAYDSDSTRDEIAGHTTLFVANGKIAEFTRVYTRSDSRKSCKE